MSLGTPVFGTPPVRLGREARLRACTLLLVDDEPANLDLLEALLSGEGYTKLLRTSDARRVVPMVEEHAPDLVLLDLHMPHRHGHDVLHDLRLRTPAGEYRPVLVLTADATWEAKERALALGARDFVTKPFDATEVLLRVENLLETRILHADQRAARERAEAAEARAALLAEWSRLLASSLDLSTSLARLPELLVPRWSAECIVHEGRGPGAPIADGEGIVASIEVRGAGERGPLDAVLLEELAARASLAAEHARLFAEAARAGQERERLLAVVAHDLRNPLGVVAMYAEMLASMQGDDTDAYTRAALATIHDGTATMQRLVEDLLDVSALRRGGLRVHRVEQLVAPVFGEAERMLRPLVEARDLTFDVINESGDPMATGAIDGPRVAQVLSNLVGNAAKFTPAGGRVTVRWRTDDEALHASVSDTGPGIAPEELPHIFTAFWQRAQRDRRGVGLGLWIARSIVEVHGGELRVDSTPDVGTTFTFTMPFAERERRWED